MATVDHPRPTGLTPEHVRVRFALEDEAPGESEVLWARWRSPHEAQIDSIPLMVFGVSLGDTVEVVELDDLPLARGVVSRGGHSTYRIMLDDPDDPQTSERLRALMTAGCGFEALTPRFIAIDVPPHVDVFRAYDMLEEGLESGLWTFEEGHCGHPLD